MAVTGLSTRTGWGLRDERCVDRIISPRFLLTVLSSLQRFLCKLVVGLIGSSDDDQFELVVLQDVVQSCVHGSSDAEPFLEFSPLGFRVPFQDSV